MEKWNWKQVFKGQNVYSVIMSEPSECQTNLVIWSDLSFYGPKLFWWSTNHFGLVQSNLFWLSPKFCSFLGVSWKLFWASCRLPYSWYYLLSPKEAQKASSKPPGSYKKFQGRNPEIISAVFWEKPILHKGIIKLTDL